MANISAQGFGGVRLGATDGTTASFATLTRITATNGSEWIYVQANGAISSGDLVAITTSGTGTRATNALAATGSELAFAQFAFADTEYGWVAINGNPLTVAVSATSTLQAVLYVATTSGKISTTSASGTLAGIALLTASTTATSGTNLAVVTWPRCVGTGN